MVGIPGKCLVDWWKRRPKNNVEPVQDCNFPNSAKLTTTLCRCVQLLTTFLLLYVEDYPSSTSGADLFHN